VKLHPSPLFLPRPVSKSESTTSTSLTSTVPHVSAPTCGWTFHPNLTVAFRSKKRPAISLIVYFAFSLRRLRREVLTLGSIASQIIASLSDYGVLR
jgi:hypothetical protein